MDALSLWEERPKRPELQRAFWVTPEDMPQAQWQRATRDHWTLDAPSAAGTAGTGLHRVGGVAAQGLWRLAADTGRLRHVALVFRDAAEETSTAA